MIRLLPILPFLAFIGCTPADGTYVVSGSVSYDGKPIPAGVVWFDPDAGNKAPQGFANIKDGKYSTGENKGRGVKPGAYIVRVEGYDGVIGNEKPLGNRLFPEYFEKREFKAEKTDYDFAIQKK